MISSILRVLGDKKDFDPVFSSLDRESAIFKDVKGVINNLKNNVIVGERIKFEGIPKYYKKDTISTMHFMSTCQKE